jgi:uncharacterized repeat protein (TIGR03803 family)
MLQFRRMTRCILLVAAALAACGGAAGAYTYHVIYNFCERASCSDGDDPQGGLVLDSAGNIYGTTVYGGRAGDGAAFELIRKSGKNRWKHELIYSFCSKFRNFACLDGSQPTGKLIVDAQGNLYGTTFRGGYQGTNYGTIFELLPGKGSLRSSKTLHMFCQNIHTCTDGGAPVSGLTYVGASAGLPYDGVSTLYGTTLFGQNASQGSAFEIQRKGRSRWRLTAMHDFCPQPPVCPDGSSPRSDLTADGNGNVFGTADTTAFELHRRAGSWKLAVLYNFCSLPGCSDGLNPSSGGLLEDGSGNLFGTTDAGGEAHGGCCGTVFKLQPGDPTWQESVVYSFCSLRNCADGSDPLSTLMMDPSGNLFGTTSAGGGNNIDKNSVGGGTVFRLSGSSLETLYSFCAQDNCVDGEYPQAGLVMDASGNLFGTTTTGGKFGHGVVFELSP